MKNPNEQNPEEGRRGRWDDIAAKVPLLKHLTPRQLEVLAKLSEDRTAAGIAAALGLSERTVESHITAIRRTLQVNTRVSAALVYLYASLCGHLPPLP